MTNEARAPYAKVVKSEFDVKGLESTKQAAQLQYQLMLMPPVLRAHIDYPNRNMELVYADPTIVEGVLNMIKPAKTTLKSREVLEYAKLVSEGRSHSA